MRVLVTGGAGFIGSHLVDALVAKRHRVTVVDDLSSGKRENLPEGVELLRQDIRSPRLADIYRDVRPEIVFHLAAQKNVRTSLLEPQLDADVNISGSLNVIDLCRRHRVRKIVFSSTGGALYGDRSKRPTPETERPLPESPYGIAKLTVEHYLRFYSRQYGLKSVSLRYANVYGPRQDPKGEAGVVAIFAQRLLRGEPLIINGHGRQTRDYVFVSDVVSTNLAAMTRSYTGEINIGTAKQTSVNRLADQIGAVSGRHSRRQHKYPAPAEVQRSALDFSRARKVLDWHPRVDLKTGLAITWDWAKEALR